jgi:hypothetical protein
MLHARKLPEEAIQASLAVAERFEEFVRDHGGVASGQIAAEFSRMLVRDGHNSLDNYYALARYGRFTGNDEPLVTFLDLLDGAEAPANLHRRAAEFLGQEARDEAFAGIGLPPLGLPSSEKPQFMHPVLKRLEQQVGAEQVRRLLSASLRDLPDRYFVGERRRYRGSKNVDEYLVKKHRAFVRELRTCRREGRLFFAQEITGDVLALVENDPEIESGRREGSTVYVTQIPYMTKQFLAETDPALKRYYACHCPWVREAIRQGEHELYRDFCYCSAGYHKRPWEVIFRRPIQVEVLESVLKGDTRCRFAIRLPDEAMPADA